MVASKFHQYQVVGRGLPTKKDPKPNLFRMKLFAPNSVVAKSRFWYFMKKVRKMKQASGEIVSVNELVEKRPQQLKNFGIWLRYNSRSNTQNMYKEFRSLTLCGAIQQLYQDMAGRHRVRFPSIQIIKTAVIPAKECKRPNVTQFHNSTIKFPVNHRIIRGDKRFRTTFKANRPQTFV